MVSLTATQKLPKPDSTDDPRQHAAYLANLGKTLDSRARSHADFIAKATLRPFALVAHNTPKVLAILPANPTDGYPVYTKVVADTAGMVDLTRNAQVITINDLGYWLVGGAWAFTGSPGGTGCSSGGIFMNLHCENATPEIFTSFVHDSNVGVTSLYCVGLAQVTDLSVPVEVFAEFITNGTGCPTTVTNAGGQMWACKVRNL